MLIRKLVVAATLVAAGAVAHAGTISASAGGKDVGNLTDSLFGSKTYTGLGVNASPAAAPIFDAAPDASVGQGATVITPVAAGEIGGGATVILPMPAQVGPINAADLVTPMADVPEPASLALMLAGMVGVGAMRRRKQQR